jgi:hypothetical protein
LKLSTLRFDDGECRLAAVSEGAHERFANGHDIFARYAERSSGHANLLDKVRNLGVSKAHKPGRVSRDWGTSRRDILVNFIHRSLAFVGRVLSAPLHRAAGENTKELVQMGEKEAGKCQAMRVS